MSTYLISIERLVEADTVEEAAEEFVAGLAWLDYADLVENIEEVES